MYCHEFLISSALFSKLNLYTKKFVFAEEASPGIYFFNARWYDGSLGRFLSPDTIVPTSTQGTQAWDRYAFVNNNPVRYTDPSRHRVDDGCQTEGCNLASLQKAINAQKLARLEMTLLD
ncbi:MAG TPA: RHS repeat-associated core domain-containing protein [Anaerolineales bacterium]|nr:RHS repeat-associated core domain-containing protein [Anaerolineales bacterium]